MKPSDVARALECCASVKQPVICWGSPGIGKSQVVHQTARALGREMVDIRASQFDAVDLRGLPTVLNGETTWAVPAFLPRANCAPTIIFLDELNRAPAMVQNALLQLILDRKLGEYTLPDQVEIVSACNRESDGGGVQKMTAALANRFVHVDMEADLEDWSRWAVRSNIEPAVIAFLRFRPALLSVFDRQARAFPSPRSWEFVSRITARKPGNGVEHALYCGCVGDGAAVEYSAFMRLFRELPNIDAILLNPTQSPVPTQPASLFAIASALAMRATVSNFARVLQYFDRLPQEYGIFGVQDAVRRDQTLTATPEFTRWAVNNSSVLF